MSTNSEPQIAGKIVHFLYRPGDGGLDRVAVLLANEMAAMGHDCELWMARGDGPVAHLVSDKVKVRIVAAPRLAGRGLHLVMQIPALAREIARTKPSVIFSAGNQSNLTLALARLLSRQKSTAIIQKITNPVDRPLMGQLRARIRRWRFGMTAKLADVILTLSSADAQAMARSYGALADRFVPVKNAYVTQSMLEAGAGRTARDPQAALKFLAVGRIAPQKGYETLIRAMALIAHLPWSLTILGDGPQSARIGELARQLGLADRIDFAGFVSDPARLYAASDALLLSSRWEGFPAVVLEALAAGCDVVATDCSPGLSELLALGGRKTVPIRDPAALAGAIEEAIAQPGEARVLRELAEQYSIAASARDHIRIAQAYLPKPISS